MLEISKMAKLPTKYGNFKVQVFKENEKEHMCFFTDNMPETPLVRIHSECLTGDVFKSIKCDCGDQLDFALKKIADSDGGMVIYLRQEGRNIGLLNKINAYNLQDTGLDTVEANEALGFKADLRDYKIVEDILEYYKIDSINLMSNNPRKLNGLKNVEIKNRVPILISACEYNENYLNIKKNKLGHLLK